jgi:hypothetical protein
MAITESGTAPAVVTNNTATTFTTATFSPPANSLIVALVSLDGNGSTPTTGTVTDSGSHTWTRLIRANATGGVGGAAEVWVLYTSTGLTNITVTVTATGGTTPGGQLAVKVLLGASSTQTGATATVASNSATASASITTTVTASWVYGAVINWANSTAYTANGSTTLIAGHSDTTNGDWYGAHKATAATGTPGATTLGFTNTAAAVNLAMAEILASTAAPAIAPPQISQYGSFH